MIFSNEETLSESRGRRMFTSPIIEINRQLADQIDREVRENPLHPYKEKVIGIASGKVVMVGDSLEQVCRSLRTIEPDNLKTYVLETDVDYSQTEYIWRCADASCVMALGVDDVSSPFADSGRSICNGSNLE